MMKTEHKDINPVPRRRSGMIALTRISFGLVWMTDAYFKWQPAFANNFVDYLKETFDGQPALIQSWLNFWINLVDINPHLFARIVALGETGIAIGLLLGLFSNLDYAAGIILALVIWSVPEGFGGPYTAGATDVGAGIIYVFGFLGLFLLSAGQHYGLDRILRPKLGRWGFLSSRPVGE
jgi:thiosulfate dehydrogenase [quinone] large subunit